VVYLVAGGFASKFVGIPQLALFLGLIFLEHATPVAPRRGVVNIPRSSSMHETSAQGR
jgi:hypothetical protein